MRLRISHAIDLTEAQAESLAAYARSLGVPGKRTRELVRRLLTRLVDEIASRPRCKVCGCSPLLMGLDEQGCCVMCGEGCHAQAQ